ncbi:MAG: phytanoyl-CoA dioxygenase family protein [Cohnella sp.]|nr:phytanoyl-CoA dioxygenase family protein [Cohnella sp.]
MLSEQQLHFFHTFGYLKFSGLMKDEIGWITEEFTQVFPMFASKIHDGSKRTSIVAFIDQREKLSSLIDDPRIKGICTSLLGDDFNYMGSDGNYYSGNTTWHPDDNNLERLHLKIAFYLDELDHSNGALRVLPGSHHVDDRFNHDLREKVFHKASEKYLGIPGEDVPAVVVDNVPGDVLVFNHNLYHSAFGGGKSRRMFTLNCSQRFADVEVLRSYIVKNAHFKRPSYYGQAMIASANPQRMKHLEQVMSQDDYFAEHTSDLPVMA